MKPSKAMTIRLSSEQAEQLETVSDIYDQSVSEIIRIAISEHIAQRQKSEEFKQGLRERIDHAQKLLKNSQKSE